MVGESFYKEEQSNVAYFDRECRVVSNIACEHNDLNIEIKYNFFLFALIYFYL